jgi:DNA-nicking Smr family endonuclease
MIFLTEEPVLKNKVKKWLIQKQEVICFVQAPNHDGGGGALITLLEK